MEQAIIELLRSLGQLINTLLVKLKAVSERSPFDGQEEGILQTDLSRRRLIAHRKAELCPSSSATSH